MKYMNCWTEGGFKMSVTLAQEKQLAFLLNLNVVGDKGLHSYFFSLPCISRHARRHQMNT